MITGIKNLARFSFFGAWKPEDMPKSGEEKVEAFVYNNPLCAVSLVGLLGLLGGGIVLLVAYGFEEVGQGRVFSQMKDSMKDAYHYVVNNKDAMPGVMVGGCSVKGILEVNNWLERSHKRGIARN